MLFRFLIILALTYAVFFLLRWWRQIKQERKTQHSRQYRHGENGKTKRKGTLVKDPETGEYRPRRDDERDGT